MTTQPFAGTSTRGFGRILWLAATFATVLWTQVRAGVPTTDATYDVLQIGPRSYTNVTITTKAKDYVFFMHSTGLINVKVSDLPREVQMDLGYLKPESATASSTKSFMNSLGVGSLTKPIENTNETGTVSSAEKVHNAVTSSPQFQFATTFLQNAQNRIPPPSQLPLKNMRERCAAAAGGFLAYMFFCYCCMWICRNAGKGDSGLVWIPFLQILPLLRAANMSQLWAFALVLPLLSIAAVVSFIPYLGPLALPILLGLLGLTLLLWFIVKVMWSFGIAKACNKSPLVAICLILPTLDVLAFLYLVFSNPNAERAQTNASRRKPRKEIMKLDPV